MIDATGLESNALHMAHLRLQKILRKESSEENKQEILQVLDDLKKISIWFERINREFKLPKHLAWSNQKELVEKEFMSKKGK